jgi:uncharacterized protein with PIN domain
MFVHFHGRLNDFLPRTRRDVRFRYALRAPASIKDVIEAIGVPHPEVALILVNGMAVDFSRPAFDEDDVAVYPFSTSLDDHDRIRAGRDPARPIRFVIDDHLRKLASLLRLGGFDALVHTDDPALAAIAAGDDRVLLTRDIALLKRRAVCYGYWVRHTDPEEQLVEVLDRYRLVGEMHPFARCTQCNTPVVAATLDAVRDRLEPCTLAGHAEFHQCPGCRRVYWRGSHYLHLRALLDRVVARLR